MPGIGDLVANLTVDAAPFAAGLKSAQTSMGSFVTGIGGLAAGIGGVLGSVWAVGESVSGYKEALEGQRKLASVLEATGNAAGLTQADIENFAGEMQNLTNFEGDATVAAASMLAAFTNVKGDVFTDAIEQAMNLSTVMGGDLESNVKLLGKALNDSADGLAKLEKAGVAFTESEKKQIAAMQESGNMMGAQEAILAKLNDSFGGAAEAVADPWTQLTNVVGDVGEMFGSILLPAIDVVAQTLNGVMSYVTGFGDTFSSAGIQAAAALSVVIDIGQQIASVISGAVSPVIDGLQEAFGSMFGLIVGEGAGSVATFGDVLRTIGTEAIVMLSTVAQFWHGIGTAIYDAVLPVLTTVGDYFGELFSYIIGDGVAAVSGWYTEAVVLLSNFGGVVAVAAAQFELFTAQIINDAAYAMTDVIPAYVTWFADNWSDVLFTAVDYTSTIFINLGQNIRNMWSAVLSFIQGNGFEFDWTPLTEGARSAIDSLPDIPERVATDFETSLQNDIAAMASDLDTAMNAQRAELTSKQDEMRQSLALQERTARDEITAKYETPKPGDKPPDKPETQKQADKTSLTAAFAGSREALQIAMRGIGGKNPVVDIAREQLKVTKEQLELQRQQASGGDGQEIVVAI